MRSQILSSLLLLSGLSLCAQEVIRGPYLQFPTHDGMKVMWRTDLPVSGRVYYGTSLDNVMDSFVEVADEVTDHTVHITGLDPLTEYYYAVAVGETVLSGGDESHRFRTWPLPGADVPVSVWAIGDFGKGNSKQRDVMNSFKQYAGDEMTDVWLWLGDNVYDDGFDQEYQDKVFNPEWGMTDLMARLPFMATPGNHDYLSISPPTVSQNPLDNEGAYFDIIDVYTNGEMGGAPSGHELYYSFDYGNVHFVNLNSEIGSVLSGSNDWTGANPFSSFNGSPMTEWLHADLQANDKPWVIAYFHQPPHSEGSHSSADLWERYMTAMRRNFCPILEQYGVDVIINGHSHVYERSYLLNGFYGTPGQFDAAQHVVDGGSGVLEDNAPYLKYTNGPNANKGTLYVVQGNSGSSTTDPALTHPAMYSTHGCSECVGSTLFYIYGDTLKGRYLTSEGVVLDEYAIVKQEAPSGVSSLVGRAVHTIEVYPNPANGTATVRFDLGAETDAVVELVTVTGQVVHTLHKGWLGKGTHRFQVDADGLGLVAGTYLVRLTSGVGHTVARLLKVQ
jgi:acid phosphatase type 7